MDKKLSPQEVENLMSKIRQVSDSKNYREDYPKLSRLEPNCIIARQKIFNELLSVSPSPKELCLALKDDWAENFGSEGTEFGAQLWYSLCAQRKLLSEFSGPLVDPMLEPVPSVVPKSIATNKSSRDSIKPDKQKILGRGNGTIVYQGTLGKRTIAVKQINFNPNDETMCISEVEALLKFDRHENIVQYFGMEKLEQDTGTTLFLALELCDFTLKQVVEKFPKRSLVYNLDILRQTTKGLAYLHLHNLIHRDIKPENVLVTELSENEVRVKITDFGICRWLSMDITSITLKTNSGTLLWKAPEVLAVFSEGIDTIKARMSTKTDIWALGCLFYFLLVDGAFLFGNCPVRGPNNVIYDKLEINLKPEYFEILSFLPLIVKMVSKDSKQRPSASAILKHHIFWDARTVLQFIIAVSNAAEKPNEGSLAAICSEAFTDHPVMKLYCEPVESLGWIRFLCKALQSYAKGNGCNRNPYKGDRPMELLRIIRNTSTHYTNLPEDTKMALGELTDSFLEYWLSRFPFLVDVVYNVFEKLKNESSAGLRDYYCEKYDFEIEKNLSPAASEALKNLVEKIVTDAKESWSK